MSPRSRVRLSVTADHLQRAEEAGEGDRGPLRALDHAFPLCVESGHRTGHDDSMVVAPPEPCTTQPARPPDLHPVGILLHLCPQAPQVLHHGGDPVGFLDPELSSIPDDRRPLRLGGEHSEHRQLVDEPWDELAPDLDRAELPAPDEDIGDRLPVDLGLSQEFHIGPHFPEDVQESDAGGVHTHISDPERAPGAGGARGDEERGGGEIPGDRNGPSPELPGDDPDPEALPLEFRAEVGEHPLGVVPGGRRLHHLRLPVGLEAGEEDGGLHLGAGHGELVGDPAEPPAPDPQGRVLPLPAGDLRPHAGEGLDDPPHGAAGEGIIAHQHRLEGPPREDPAQKPHGRPRVPTIQRSPGRGEALRARAPDHHHIPSGGYLHPQSPEAPGGALHIGGRGEALDLGLPLGQRSQEQGPVGDGFIPRDPDLSPERPRPPHTRLHQSTTSAS